ncbi:cytochrome c [Afifella sp. IM 167]|uniref:c-type cytochrome n=1 Tax=Afifella sp. IM 167 TaxID=2033586 RepID=UPI001CC9887F|nr:cytochrome c [Afifella sp. IM 167]MBZ8134031.1 cytochrome C [Afifella sp. IM 167]
MRLRTLLGACAMLAAVHPAQAETLLERGTYLMNSIAACGNCHTPVGPEGPVAGMELAGQLIQENEAFTAYAGNITPDVETGIGAWSDEELIHAIREGVRPDGTIIGPPMPIELYRGMSDTDVKAIVAYLRAVPPVKNRVPKSTYNIPLPASYGPPVGHVGDVPHEDILAYGGYLAGPVGHCVECHTPMVGPRRDFENQLGAGGFAFPGPWGISTSANITPHENGIAHLSDAQVARILKEGVRPDGSKMLPPMPYAFYAHLKDEDLQAIIAYLRSLPPKPFPG